MAKNGKTFTFKVYLKEKKNHKNHDETGIKLAPIRLCSRENHQQEYFVNFESKTRTWTWIPNVVKKFMEVDQKSIFFV